MRRIAHTIMLGGLLAAGLIGCQHNNRTSQVVPQGKNEMLEDTHTSNMDDNRTGDELRDTTREKKGIFSQKIGDAFQPAPGGRDRE